MYFDTHAHYYDRAFDADRDDVLAALPAAGVDLALCPGCDLESSRQSVALAEQYPHLYAAVGFHPENLEGARLSDLAEIEAMAAHPRVKAIGEIGLDYYWEKDPDRRRIQRDFFSAQLSLAEQLDLPAIVHDREAHRDSLDMVRAHPNARGVFHCYSGGVEDAKTLVIMGWMVSFTGVITFKNARRALEVIQWLPMDRIMIETDAPYMAPEPYRGRRNDSRYVFRMAEAIAQVKGLTAEEVGRITTENGKRFFNIP
ncbi:TatD family hydrolase [Pseudoflavonifractor capillosus]|uniref:TatD family hydrolase n=1 Tax=Pseudoflavonifractor capillosus TaxID=106588 RepID=A0A921MNU6_9FIRM|nr:TatD family hydrolase [Pseudoflavonifractor capillosus]HJG87807.1 TatD family hydrolase [Pseudoflavonifractor capillosus]